MRRSRWGTIGVACYLLGIVVAGAVAVVRLSDSTEMLGLAAVELVLLALPWSLLLGQQPLTQASLVSSSALVGAGLVLNAACLYAAAGVLERRWKQRHEHRAA
jgi:hypothetical protein